MATQVARFVSGARHDELGETAISRISPQEDKKKSQGPLHSGTRPFWTLEAFARYLDFLPLHVVWRQRGYVLPDGSVFFTWKTAPFQMTEA